MGRRPYRRLINKDALAILRVCRLVYQEAEPLAIPNLEIKCNGNADVIDLLSKMSPVQITQLRNLRVWQFAVGFKLFSGDDDSQSDAPEGGREDMSISDDDDDDDDDSATEAVQYFHLGAVLGLFPGLQLDLLRVHCGVGGGPYTAIHNSHCFQSLLEADGYQRLWMDATTGDSEPWDDILSLETWHDSIITRFRPYSHWRVRLNVPSYADDLVDGLQQNKEWESLQAGRIDLVVNEDSDESDGDSDLDTDCEGTVGIVIDRGDADVAVKRDDSPVLRCVYVDRNGPSPRFYKKVSDALRKLFRENSWEAIKAMDGFYDGAADCDSEGGTVYADYW
ncbi:hypothetical protein P168DRAFT_329108 [Aspergillus campestris IBT 28561]|uniref:Uncharacterized protein n=1 Tax=Aspergillus campestris (strain IBT 28561) TaxID=1392248 RepID=A0A2I1CWY8_ASPC2|nr:uncharacterized protein P168DRAFT_329108 [Aspergillus campestris IBT 28561]PKY02137.1 hypothetical protein P168DRAFT_329108 [Aspergillus campestris IBT 28561]